jgi:hypothetical protein
MLYAANFGYQQKRQEIDARMADLRQRLGGSPAPAAWAAARKAESAVAAAPAPAKTAKQKRRLSPEGRERIIAATKKRWAVVRKAKAAR